jgi:WD40 repeat protein
LGFLFVSFENFTIKCFQVAIAGCAGSIKVYHQNLSVKSDSIAAHTNCVNRIKQSPFNINYNTNGYVATASSDFTVNIWNSWNNWNLIRNYTGHTGGVYGLEWINEDTIASGDASGIINLWSISTGLTNKSIITNAYGVLALQLMCNSNYLAAGLANKNVQIYNLNNGSLIATLTGHTDKIYDLALLSSDLLASSSDDHTVRIWNLTTNTLKFNLAEHSNIVRSLKLVSTDILASGSNDLSVKLLNITSGSLIRTTNYTNSISFLVDLLDSQTLVCGTGGVIDLSNLTTGERINMVNTITSFRSMAVLNSNITTSKYLSLTFFYVNFKRVIGFRPLPNAFSAIVNLQNKYDSNTEIFFIFMQFVIFPK